MIFFIPPQTHPHPPQKSPHPQTPSTPFDTNSPPPSNQAQAQNGAKPSVSPSPLQQSPQHPQGLCGSLEYRG